MLTPPNVPTPARAEPPMLPLAGPEFHDIRCVCRKLLMRVAGLGCIIETVCPRCGAQVRWPTLAVEVTPRLATK